MEELKRLTTKKSKADFIRSLPNKWHDNTMYDILLLAETQKALLPEKVIGAAALRARINQSVRNFKDDTKTLESLEKTDITAGNDYYAFMYSPGVPAYLKLAVIQAQRDAGKTVK